MTEAEALIALNQLPKIGPVKIRALLERFGSGVATLKQADTTLQQTQGIGPETAKIIASWQDFADPSAELTLARERNIQILTQDNPDYPAALRDMYDAPVVLYVWGNLMERDIHAIGIVGSRKLTHYGREAARKFSFQLASAGLTVISGLARGIDTAAHEGAIAAKGRTIGVLGSGLMQIYPPENLALAEKIASGHGAIVSEFSLQTTPDKKTFPQRNRIVAHWSRALLVVECPSRSGSLITANMANEAGRTIYAVPGPIDRPTSGGCHDLIRDGATLVTDGSHILDDFSNLPLTIASSAEPESSPVENYPNLTDEENLILKALSGTDSSVDELVRATDLPASKVSVTLMKLELRQIVVALPGQRFQKRSSRF